MHADGVAVDDILRLVDIERVMAVLVVPASNEAVAILATGNIVGVFAVLAFDPVVVLDGELGNRGMEVIPLFQKSAGVIVGDTVASGVPAVAPPACRAVHGKWGAIRIHRNDAFPAEITRSTVEIALIPPCQSPLLTAIGAQGRWWDQFFLPGKHR